MTKLELRILQLLSREGGRASHVLISTRTSRNKAAERDMALQLLEQQELVSSAVQPTKRGGREGGGGMVYWLTEAGKAYVEDARARGEIRDKIKPVQA